MIKPGSLTDEGAPPKCQMQPGQWDYSAGFRPRSFFSSGGFVGGTDEAANRGGLTGLAIRHRLPNVYGFRYYPMSGGLASYGTDNIELYRRAASYVDRILKGEKPSDLPVQQ